jgi:hypothetical protein
MKKLQIIYSCLIISMLVITSCKKDSILNQTPPTQLSDATFWHTTSDLQNYMNTLYTAFNLYTGFGNIGIYSVDGNSDNMVTSSQDQRLNGQYNVNSNGGYPDYTRIRTVNYFLANYTKVTAAPNAVAPFVGEAYFFRAMLYFQALQSYGGVPYITKPLNINDQAGLNVPRVPRNVLADSIINDLDKAIANLPAKSVAQTQRIYKEYAEGYKARVCLYEGTWEKYHENDVFGVSGQSGASYLQLASDAANTVITSGVFKLDNVRVPNGYFNLFNQTDYSSSKEVMFWAAFSQADGIVSEWQSYFPAGASTGISKALADDYLCTDGNPISVSPLYKGDDSLAHVFKNRDPRLRQSTFFQGDTVISGAPGNVPDGLFAYPQFLGVTPCTTGYQIKKGFDSDFYQDSHNGAGGTTGVIYMRYAEILLIYAEARAELGLITQADADITINALRDRVGMPHLNIGAIPTDPKWEFPDLSPVINEIRRERHVELACEGYRLNDICRWAAAPELIVGKQPLGAKANQFVTVVPGLIIGTNISVNAQGYVEPYAKVPAMAAGYQFNVNRDYLLPISLTQIVINPAIKQNPGW